MAVGFLGYILPWGQMSYWGATVICNFLSVIPIIGKKLVIWVWGGFRVKRPTLSRFFSLHFFLPMIIRVLVLVHLIFLHFKYKGNPLGIKRNKDYFRFFPYYIAKDLLGFSFLALWVGVFLYFPESFLETQNYIEANPLVTPSHIQPE